MFNFFKRKKEESEVIEETKIPCMEIVNGMEIRYNELLASNSDFYIKGTIFASHIVKKGDKLSDIIKIIKPNIFEFAHSHKLHITKFSIYAGHDVLDLIEDKNSILKINLMLDHDEISFQVDTARSNPDYDIAG